MLISSLISLKITQLILVREMINLEIPRRITSNLLHLGKQFVLSSLQKVPTNHDVANAGSSSSNRSAEYIIHHWLEALFAWFQMIILWHEPMASVCAFTGFFASFLLLTSFAPRFYATILLGLFAYNLIKVWFRYIWPEIRVPLDNGRDEELRVGVDRWTHLHPHLLTLEEFKKVTENLMKAGETHLHKLLVLRREKPATFCLAICSTLSCTALIGSRISDLKLLFIATSVLTLAPGIYLHVLPKAAKNYLRNLINLNQLLITHSSSDNESSIPKISSSPSAPIPITPIALSTSSSSSSSSPPPPATTTTSLLDHFKWALNRQEQPTLSLATSTAPSSDLVSDKVPIEDDQQEKLVEINQLVLANEDSKNLSNKKQPLEGSAESGSNNESASLIDFEDDQDGFVIL